MGELQEFFCLLLFGGSLSASGASSDTGTHQDSEDVFRGTHYSSRELWAVNPFLYSVLRIPDASVSPKSLLCLLNSGRPPGSVWVHPAAAAGDRSSQGSKEAAARARLTSFVSLLSGISVL